MAYSVLRDSTLANHVHGPSYEEYKESMGSYWSKQQMEVTASGVFKPRTTIELASAVKLLHDANIAHGFAAEYSFAIRSGGHAPSPGSSNIQSGLVIDIRSMKELSISEHNSTVTAGAGASFEDVYAYLEPLGLSIPGARVAQVGVSGFTLGGGLSYYSAQHGFVCDNVEEFEIVIADGSILKANAQSHSDLFKALKGGGNNFGIVTAITFKTIPKEDLWGGSTLHKVSDFNAAAQYLHQQVTSPDYDRDASIYVAIGHLKSTGDVALCSLKYTKPVKDAPIFKGFTDLETLHNTVRISPLAELTVEEGKFSLPGERCLWMTVSFNSDPAMLHDLQNIWQQTLDKVKLLEGIEWSFVLHPIVPAAIREGNARGGNALGLTDCTEPVIIVMLVGTWDHAEDDELGYQVSWEAIGRITDRAKELGVFNRYIYMNYAWKGQEVIEGYGKEMKEWLRGVSERCDPDGLFQEAVPGGFKISV